MRKGVGVGRIGDVDDQRVIRRPAFGPEDLCDRRIIVGTRSQAVDSLGRKGDQFAGCQPGCSQRHGCGVSSVQQGGSHQLSMPSSAAALRATASARAAVAPVMVRWPILRATRGLALPYR